MCRSIPCTVSCFESRDVRRRLQIGGVVHYVNRHVSIRCVDELPDWMLAVPVKGSASSGVSTKYQFQVPDEFLCGT